MHPPEQPYSHALGTTTTDHESPERQAWHIGEDPHHILGVAVDNTRGEKECLDVELAQVEEGDWRLRHAGGRTEEGQT
jgi:hypothetical protein